MSNLRKGAVRFFSVSCRALQETPVNKFVNKWGKQNSSSSISQLQSIIDYEKDKSSEEKIEINSNIRVRLSESQAYDPFDFTIAKYKLAQFAHSRGRRSENNPFPTNHRGSSLAKSKYPEDVYRRIKLNPLKLYTFGPILNKYVSENGSIYHRTVNSNLAAKTHKKMAKAITRARAAGIVSTNGRATINSGSTISSSLDGAIQAYHDRNKDNIE